MWRREADPCREGRGCVYSVDADFYPLPLLSGNTGKGPDYRLSVSSQPIVYILKPCWELGGVQAQLKIPVCGVCSALPSLLRSRGEFSSVGESKTKRDPPPPPPPPDFLAPGSSGADFPSLFGFKTHKATSLP